MEGLWQPFFFADNLVRTFRTKRYLPQRHKDTKDIFLLGSKKHSPQGHACLALRGSEINGSDRINQPE
jgi:hypothetical protein